MVSDLENPFYANFEKNLIFFGFAILNLESLISISDHKTSCILKGTPHKNSEKDTLPGIPKNFGRCSGMQNDDLSQYFQLPLPPPSRNT